MFGKALLFDFLFDLHLWTVIWPKNGWKMQPKLGKILTLDIQHNYVIRSEDYNEKLGRKENDMSFSTNFDDVQLCLQVWHATCLFQF